jgi:hypothetical protein
VWIKESDSFLRPEKRLWYRALNLKHLTEAQSLEAETRHVPRKVVELFEYGKQEGYWSPLAKANV